MNSKFFKNGVSAKNGEKNLPILFSRMPKLSGEVEFILVCAKSNDLTLENAFKIKAEYKDLNIK